jgi:hypothetical protein
MDKSDRAKLLQLMEERPAVEEWRMGLTDWERRNLNNPVIVWRKWTAATRVRKPKPRTAGVSGAEHGRAKAIIEELQGRNAELEQELEAAQATTQVRLEALQERNAELEQELTAARSARTEQPAQEDATEEQLAHCSFCRKDQNNVAVMVRGKFPGIFICDDCVDMAAHLVAEKRAAKATSKADHGTAEAEPESPSSREAAEQPAAAPVTLTWIEDAASSRKHPTFYADTPNGGGYALAPHKNSKGEVFYAVRFNATRQGDKIDLATSKSKLSLDAAKEFAEQHARSPAQQ